MKIHFPLLGFNLSGGIRVIINLANGLVERGHEVRITVPAFRAEPPFPLDRRVDLTVLGDVKNSRIRYVSHLVSEAGKWGDFLIATNFKTPSLLYRSIRRSRTDAVLVYFVQGYEPLSQGTLFEGPFWRKALNRQIALKSYGVTPNRIYVSRWISKQVGKDENPNIVHPGVDTDIFFPQSKPREGPLKVGVIFSSQRLKGFEDFRSAWDHIVSKRKDVTADILCPEEQQNLSIPNSTVKTVSGDHELAEFYRDLDIFVFPSLIEGYGLPPLEAMASGVAVITTDCGGVLEFATDQQNSLIVLPGDVDGLARALLELIQNSTLRTQLSREGVKTAIRFSWNQFVQKFEQYLKRLRRGDQDGGYVD